MWGETGRCIVPGDATAGKGGGDTKQALSPSTAPAPAATGPARSGAVRLLMGRNGKNKLQRRSCACQ
jgi:hypothetical protein